MSQKEIVDYLQTDIRESVIDDVKPCLTLGVPRGGYFSVPRLVLGYVDYLGALYHGYTGQNTNQGRRIFARASYAKEFLHDVFAKVDPEYAKYGNLLWEIYRNGPVHLYEPLNLKNPSGSIIQWQIFKSEDKSAILPIKFSGGHKKMLVIHLLPVRVESNEWIQPISTGCLYNDLLAAIDEYTKMIQTDPDLEIKFRDTVNELILPENTSLTWP